jgi:hypothetical protein
MNVPYIKIILAVVVALIYAVMFLLKKAQEQAAIKRAKDDQARRRLDELRTGRVEQESVASTVVVGSQEGNPTPLSHQEATRRLQELAERRRQQLDELRKRAAAQGQPVPTSLPPATVPAPQQARPAKPQARPVIARQTGPAPARRGAPRPVPAERPAKIPRPPNKTNAEKRRASDEVDETERLARRDAQRAMGKDKPATKQAPAAPVAGMKSGMGKILLPNGKAGAAEWRRIMMLREILATPVALRDQNPDVR